MNPIKIKINPISPVRTKSGNKYRVLVLILIVCGWGVVGYIKYNQENILRQQIETKVLVLSKTLNSTFTNKVSWRDPVTYIQKKLKNRASNNYYKDTKNLLENSKVINFIIHKDKIIINRPKSNIDGITRYNREIFYEK